MKYYNLTLHTEKITPTSLRGTKQSISNMSPRTTLKAKRLASSDAFLPTFF